MLKNNTVNNPKPLTPPKTYVQSILAIITSPLSTITSVGNHCLIAIRSKQNNHKATAVVPIVRTVKTSSTNANKTANHTIPGTLTLFDQYQTDHNKNGKGTKLLSSKTATKPLKTITPQYYYNATIRRMKTQDSLPHLLLSLLLSLIILGLSLQNKVHWASTPINHTLTPLRSPFYLARIYFDHQAEFLQNLPHQQRLIDDLKRQNDQLSLKANETQDLTKENEALKKLLSAKESPNHRAVSAKVTSLSRFATLNQGSNIGIISGLPVVSEDLLVGITASVSQNLSQVRLLSDPDTKIAATTLNGISGELIFENNSLRLTKVPQKELLEVDTPVFTSGSDGLPDGLLIGHLTQINNNESSAYQSANLKPAADITASEYVFVLLD